MRPCRRQITSASSAKWIRRAESLARSIRSKSGTKREIQDGYLIEGRRSGRLLSARVIDPPGRIAIAGLNAGDRISAYSYWRDDLRPQDEPQEPESVAKLGARAGVWPQAGGSLLLRDPAEAYAFDLYDGFIHGVTERDDGYRVVGLTFAKPAIISGSPAIRYYNSPGNDDLFFRFVFQLISGGATADAQPATTAGMGGPTALSLEIDSDWIEAFIGGGARLVMSATSDGAGSYKEPLNAWGGFFYFYDSQANRWAMPWVVAQPTEIASKRVQWRVTTRYGEPLVKPTDAWGRWKLATFIVDVEIDEDGEITATPSALTTYDPFASSDPSRIAEEETAGIRLNLFGFPAVAPDGAVMITHVADMKPDQLPGMPMGGFSFNSVLLTTTGEFVEVVGLPADTSNEMGVPCYGKERSMFFGGSDGVMVNPFIAENTVALVSTVTGEVTLVPRPFMQIPLALTLGPGDRTNRLSITDDMCKNVVGRIRPGVICWPVTTASTATTSNMALAVMDLSTNEVEVRGIAGGMVPIIDRRSGISKPVAVQYEVVSDSPGEADASPAILLWGARGSNAGETYVSYDSGYTWHQISEDVGPSRAIWYAGSVIHTPRPGMLWVDRAI